MQKRALDPTCQEIYIHANHIITQSYQAFALAQTMLTAKNSALLRQISIINRSLRTRQQSLMAQVRHVERLNIYVEDADARYISTITRVTQHTIAISNCALAIADMAYQLPFSFHAASRFSTDYLDNEHHISEQTIVEAILSLSQQIQQLLVITQQHFQQSEKIRIENIEQDFQSLELRYLLIRHNLLAYPLGIQALVALEYDTYLLERAKTLLWITHQLKYIITHGTAICKHVAYIQSGVDAPVWTSF